MKYPLQQLQTIKKKRLEEAERLLKEKKETLSQEEERLLEAEKIRDKTLHHRDKKVAQLQEEFSKGTTSDRIETADRYLKVVGEELKKKEMKVVEQKLVVEKAEKAVEAARKEMLQKQQDVEKLKIHKKEWQKQARLEEKRKDDIETDELGSAMHTLRKKREKDG
ncbi:MAG: type III secretion T3S chaperone [Simkaniaceae bacterium]